MATNVSGEIRRDYDREEQLKAFDNTKAGTKGLVDSGIDTLPKIFIQPLDEVSGNCSIHAANLQVPLIDLSGFEKDENRKRIVEEIRDASEKWGFFQVMNHGIPLDVLDSMLKGVQMFHEQDSELKKEFYSRDRKQVVYNSKYDLYKSKAANWRDTLTINNSSTGQLDSEMIPPIWWRRMSRPASSSTRIYSILEMQTPKPTACCNLSLKRSGHPRISSLLSDTSSCIYSGIYRDLRESSIASLKANSQYIPKQAFPRHLDALTQRRDFLIWDNDKFLSFLGKMSSFRKYPQLLIDFQALCPDTCKYEKGNETLHLVMNLA